MCLHQLKNIVEMFRCTISFQQSKNDNIFCELIPFKIPHFKELEQRMQKYKTNPSSWWHALVSTYIGLFYSKEGARILNGDWTMEDKTFLEELYQKVLNNINNLGYEFTLYSTSKDYFGRLYALKYKGTNSNFGWHYDALSPQEYRAIFTIRQKGKRRLCFAYKDIYKNTVYMKPDVGYGVLIRSGETFHAVLQDKECIYEDTNELERWVLVFTYTKIRKDMRQYIGAVDNYFRKYKS